MFRAEILGLDNLLGYMSLENIYCPFLSNHLFPVVLYLGMRPCSVSLIYANTSIGVTIV